MLGAVTHKPSLIAVLLVAACSKDDGKKPATTDKVEPKTEKPAPAAPPEPACPPLTFTINGEPRTGFVHGLATRQESSADTAWQVEMYNHDAVTCEEVLSKSGRQVKEGELDVRAFSGQRYWGVGYGSHAQMATAPVELVGAPPEKPGDEVVLCAAEHAFTRQDGTRVVIAGTFKGTYCGVMKF
jgi:hypothetical protein